jgi:hypothetical protein
MADTKLTGLAALSAVPDDADYVYVVDVSDTSMAASGTSKKNLAKYFIRSNGTANTLGAAIDANSNNITGAGTVSALVVRAKDGNGLKLYEDGGTTGVFVADSGNVAIGHTSPDYKLDISGSLQATTAGLAWVSVTFNTGWGDTGGGNQTCQYKKFGDFVFLRGLATRSSGVLTTMFALPSGFRPAAGLRFPALTDAGAHAAVTIDTSGNVADLVGSPTDYISLDGIIFSTA